MNIKALEYFLKIAEKENITEAAKELGMAQPPLSRQLRNLEEELGVQLFLRTSRKMVLTEEGRVLRERAEQILNYVTSTEHDIRSMKDDVSGTISIVGVESYIVGGLPRIYQSFREKYPQVQGRIVATSSKEAMHLVEIGGAEIGFVRRYNEEDLEGFEFIDVEKSNWAAVIPKDHPLAQQEGDEVTAEELAQCDIILPVNGRAVERLQGAFLEKGLELHSIAVVEPQILSFECAAKGIGIALTSRSSSDRMHEGRVVVKDIKDFQYLSTVSMIYGRYYSLSRAAKAFVDEVVRHSEGVE